MACEDSFLDCGSASAGLTNFCCAIGTQCIWLAANTTVVCCPDGASCNIIEPIPCDLNLQNPQAPIKTTALNVKLGTCGNGLCCPHGYECTNGNCEMLSVQNVAPGEKNAGVSATSSAASTTSTTSTTATTETARPVTTETTRPVTTEAARLATTTNSPAERTSETSGAPAPDKLNTPSDAVRLGVPIGLTLLFLIILGVLVFIVWRRRRATAWNSTSERKSQHRFDKAELDASSCEISMPARVKQGWELDATQAPNELPATPLTMSRLRFGGKAELA